MRLTTAGAPVRAQVLKGTPVAAAVAPEHQTAPQELSRVRPRGVQVIHCCQWVPLPRPRILQTRRHVSTVNLLM